MAALIAVAAIIVIAMLSGIGYKVHQAGVESCELDHQKQQAKINELQSQLQTQLQQWASEAQRDIDKGLAEYRAGQVAGAKQGANVRAKAKENAASDAGLSNANCSMSDGSLQFINRTIDGMRGGSAPDSGGTAEALPSSHPSAGPPVREPIPVDNRSNGSGRPVDPVHPEGRQTDRSGQVSGSAVQEGARKKPQPVGRISGGK